MKRPIWQPSPERIARAQRCAFSRFLESRWHSPFDDYALLHRFSVEAPDRFWGSLWDFLGIAARSRGDAVVRDFDRMPGAQFFPDAVLNVAENAVRHPDSRLAIVAWNENRSYRTLTRAELYAEVSRTTAAFRSLGVRAGDRVAGYLPNIPEAVVAALAAASLGAVWSSCSPDFGVEGVIDRFGQIEPRVFIGTDGYRYGGKDFQCLERLEAIAGRLPSVERFLVVPWSHTRPRLDGLPPRTMLWPDLLAPHPANEIRFEPLPFNHPLYILYSSGTTGPPKCLVHGAGGTLLQHLKEHRLHCDIGRGDRVLYFTTCGWMMWNWLVSALASEATILLYDGSPVYPNSSTLFDFADATDMTFFGTSAKFIDSLRKGGVAPLRSHRLTNLRTVTSTGSPLAPEGFDFVYDHIKGDVHLASISGGTDIIGCFVAGNPCAPVWRGEIQSRALGMKVEVFDDAGRATMREKGELVCTAPFPSMPLRFWNDPNGTAYRSAYFEKYPGVWAHGDYAELTEHGGVIIHGRSDAVLNPGGVRIGTAEIYRQVEQLDEVVESLVVGQQWQGDERIILFVRLRDGTTLADTLADRITQHVRRNTTPRHAPARIVQVRDIPRTKSGKIVELAVRDVIHGRPVKNRESLANPEVLPLFENLPELQQ